MGVKKGWQLANLNRNGLATMQEDRFAELLAYRPLDVRFQLPDYKKDPKAQAKRRKLPAKAKAKVKEKTDVGGEPGTEGIEEANEEDQAKEEEEEEEQDEQLEEMWPDMLVITTTKNVGSGRYAMVTGVLANGYPLWKKVDEQSWIYTAPHGRRWFIGEAEQAAEGFETNLGSFCVRRRHGGASPQRFPAADWMFWDDEECGWQKNIDIKIEAETVTGPGQLPGIPWAFIKEAFVWKAFVPAGAMRVDTFFPFAGLFRLIPGEKANGAPIWQHEEESFWLFLGQDGRWCIGDTDAQVEAFECNGEMLRSGELSRGLAPQDVKLGAWQYRDREVWKYSDDTCITVDLEDAGPAGVFGTSATAWAKTYRREKNMKAEKERLATWQPADIILVKTELPYAGVYQVVPNELRNGRPLWQRHGSQDYVYFGMRSGLWIVGDKDEWFVDFECDTGKAKTKDKAFGRGPDQMASEGWLLFQEDEDTWKDAEGFEVLTGGAGLLVAMQALRGEVDTAYVGLPKIPVPFEGDRFIYVSGTQFYGGLYEKVPDQRPNGMPLWQRAGSTDYMYHGGTGRWTIGDDNEQALGFDCNTGNLRCKTKVENEAPYAPGHREWSYWDGGKWHDAPSVEVFAESTALWIETETLQEVAKHEELAADKSTAREQALRDEVADWQAAGRAMGDSFVGVAEIADLRNELRSKTSELEELMQGIEKEKTKEDEKEKLNADVETVTRSVYAGQARGSMLVDLDKHSATVLGLMRDIDERFSLTDEKKLLLDVFHVWQLNFFRWRWARHAVKIDEAEELIRAVEYREKAMKNMITKAEKRTDLEGVLRRKFWVTIYRVWGAWAGLVLERKRQGYQGGEAPGGKFGPPQYIEVTTGVYAHGRAGLYKLIVGEKANGYPIWQREGATDFFYCGTKGQWFVGDLNEKGMEFMCNTGHIASTKKAKGKSPDKVEPGSWLYFDGEDWHVDSALKVMEKEADRPNAYRELALVAYEDDAQLGMRIAVIEPRLLVSGPCGLPEGTILVKEVLEGGWAAANGVLPGSVIVTTNGEQTANMDADRFKRALAGRPLRLCFLLPDSTTEVMTAEAVQMAAEAATAEQRLAASLQAEAERREQALKQGETAEKLPGFSAWEIATLTTEVSEERSRVAKLQTILATFEITATEMDTRLGLMLEGLPPSRPVVSDVAMIGWAREHGVATGCIVAAVNGEEVTTMPAERFNMALHRRPLTLAVYRPPGVDVRGQELGALRRQLADAQRGLADTSTVAGRDAELEQMVKALQREEASSRKLRLKLRDYQFPDGADGVDDADDDHEPEDIAARFEQFRDRSARQAEAQRVMALRDELAEVEQSALHAQKVANTHLKEAEDGKEAARRSLLKVEENLQGELRSSSGLRQEMAEQDRQARTAKAVSSRLRGELSQALESTFRQGAVADGLRQTLVSMAVELEDAKGLPRRLDDAARTDPAPRAEPPLIQVGAVASGDVASHSSPTTRAFATTADGAFSSPRGPQSSANQREAMAVSISAQAGASAAGLKREAEQLRLELDCFRKARPPPDAPPPLEPARWQRQEPALLTVSTTSAPWLTAPEEQYSSRAGRRAEQTLRTPAAIPPMPSPRGGSEEPGVPVLPVRPPPRPPPAL
eukprot:TRINITY_DN27442_c0_g1_i1.p1 TRINITY_DN27442_c0_g1~~TRINITY_DN27442_c0_g1_i1.p1  ORF type:complete len:1756 (+),score=439.53 TRINITY_DN27442_c0_g1_i1:378-5270(+)